MLIDDDVRYRAVCSRDARFDGKFFTGVTSTGVYCRPVCPAKTPRRENVRFFGCAAGAEAAGFRPCKRCRPETAPGTPVWSGTEASVTRATRLIDAGFLEDHSIEELAAHLGMGGRHLRRLFLRHVGVPPKALDSVRKTHLAAALLAETDLPITIAAFDAGFHSVRQFNEAFKRSFGFAPSEIRKKQLELGVAGESAMVLHLSYRPPFDWEGLLKFFRDRAIAGVESAGDTAYRRSFRLPDAPGSGILEVQPADSANSLLVAVSAPPLKLSALVARVRLMFDLLADPDAIAAHLQSDPVLRELAVRFPGIRIPGSWDPFETAVRAVVGQQISVKAAVGLLGKIALLCGTPMEGVEGTTGLLFPTPGQLEAADLERIGMPQARRRTLKAIARAWLDGTVPIDGYASADELVESLRSIPGVGPWTAHYIALRAFGEPDAFPASDLGLRVAAGRLLGGGTPASAAQVARLAEAWRPWRGYAAQLLWRSLTPRPPEVEK